MWRWATLQDHSHPAWQRLKAEELLAQQLSQPPPSASAPAWCASALRPQTQAGGTPLHEQLLGVLPFSLTRRAAPRGEEIARDLARPVPAA